MTNIALRKARKFRIRKRIKGTTSIPRLTVFRSNTYIYAQLIDDENSKTIASATDMKKENVKEGKSKVEKAFIVGELLAGIALKNKVKKIVFDRSGYKYHGRVKSLAEGARKGGLEF